MRPPGRTNASARTHRDPYDKGMDVATVETPDHYAPPDALMRAGADFPVPDTLLVPHFVAADSAASLLDAALADFDWQQERFVMFGRWATAPRLSVCFGEPGAAYRYSGVERLAQPWPDAVQSLAKQVSSALQWRTNFVLVNRYRSGRDHLGWHSDDERDMGPAPVVATVSIGVPRTFRMAARRKGSPNHDVVLESGSLFLMWGRSQRHYRHCVPRRLREAGERVSFSFRCTANVGTA
ncbi:MAG: alpha-ketoglutarate-dependent dioxygenase AlkB [Gammaproteobacteria bacterium]|nr:alpha-ketoglutarate-dependent dioxygenase AlkB [Gammaproteobacteria bacterium]MYB36821.1 alpha-ketoglutarate-dependent dioxygenase AlkB [Gammaproteobacteria bacterium]